MEKEVVDKPIALISFKFQAKSIGKADQRPIQNPHIIGKYANDTVVFKSSKKKTDSPWSETFYTVVYQSEKRYDLSLSVKNKGDLFNPQLGTTILSFEKIIPSSANVTDHNFSLDITLTKNNKPNGELHVEGTVESQKVVMQRFWFGFARHFDTNNDTFIDKNEFFAMLDTLDINLSEEEKNDMFEKADINKDQLLSTEEFFNLVTEGSDFTIRRKIFGSDELTNDMNTFIWDTVCNSLADDQEYSIGTTLLHHLAINGHRDVLDSPAQEKLAKSKKSLIYVQDRETGKLILEKIPTFIKISLRMLYSTRSGRFAVSTDNVKKLLKKMTLAQANKYISPKSVKDIPSFIKFHNLNMDEVLDPVTSFKNFNEFFYRKLKPEVRPIYERENPAVAVCPADCRLHVFETIDDSTRLWIKGRNFTLHNLLENEQLERDFESCSVVIARLAPQDYHRFHHPITGHTGTFIHQGSAYFTVNPIAVREQVDVYTENKRISVLIESPEFGKMMYICVGATMVGSINLTTQENSDIKKGDEHGYFAFGGSTILLLFQKGRIKFESDLLLNSQKALETLVKFGQKLGEANK
jgi:phosphatidylserine decarboxylase